MCSRLTEHRPVSSTANEAWSKQSKGPAHVRSGGLLISLGCLVILVAAWHLEPYNLPLGPGSHLSLPGCALRERTGYPCPTCGMTRAWAKAVRGDLGAAFQANIAGTVFFVVCVAGGFFGLGTVLGGRSFYHRYVKPVLGLLRPRQWLYAGLGLIGLAWGLNGLWAFLAKHRS